jgi:hypothetical protein
VVYCGGLENRFGGNADGGSNPSLSASFAAKQMDSKTANEPRFGNGKIL